MHLGTDSLLYLAEFGENSTHLFLTALSATPLFHIYMVDGWWVDGLVGGWYVWCNMRASCGVLARGGTGILRSIYLVHYPGLASVVSFYFFPMYRKKNGDNKKENRIETMPPKQKRGGRAWGVQLPQSRDGEGGREAWEAVRGGGGGRTQLLLALVS